MTVARRDSFIWCVSGSMQRRNLRAACFGGRGGGKDASGAESLSKVRCRISFEVFVTIWNRIFALLNLLFVFRDAPSDRLFIIADTPLYLRWSCGQERYAASP